MSISLALQSALSGLRLNQTAVEVTANNVANANTPGYTRKSVESTSQLVGGVAGGVQITGIVRQVSETLLRDLRTQGSSLGEAKVKDAFFSRIQDLFGGPGDNSSLSAAIASLTSTVEALAATPEGVTQRTQFVAQATSLARQLNDMADQVQRQRADADRQIADTVGIANGNMQIIAELNERIVTATGLGEGAAGLMDQRDTALQKLAELVDISTFTRPAGDVVVMTRGGRPLVDRVAARLDYTPSAAVHSTITYAGGGFSPLSLNGTDITAELRSGELAGLIAMRDTELPGFADALDALAETLRDQLNAAHNLGSAAPPLNTLTGADQGLAAGTAFAATGTVRIAVVNADGTFAGAPLDLALGGIATVGDLVTAINAGLGGLGTASIVSGKLQIAAAASDDGIAIGNGTADVGGRGFSHHFGLNNLFTDDGASAAARIAVRSDVAANPMRVATARLSDVASGSVTAGKTTAVGAGDNGNAQGLSDALGAASAFAATGVMPALTMTIGEYAAHILGNNAARASQSESDLDFRTRLVDDLTAKAGSVSGVNVDEELANLVLYQNAYAAAARLVSAAQEMMRVLDEIMR